MSMSGESLLIILLVGLIAGWLAGHFVQGSGFGLIGDLIIGIVGALIGGWLLPQLRHSSRLGPCRSNHKRHYRGSVAPPRHQARSWWRRLEQRLGERLGTTLVVVASHRPHPPQDHILIFRPIAQLHVQQ